MTIGWCEGYRRDFEKAPVSSRIALDCERRNLIIRAMISNRRDWPGSQPVSTGAEGGIVGITGARGSIIGRGETREYDFLVDTGATWPGIAQEDIDTLGLDTVPNAAAALMIADGTRMRRPIYIAVGMLEGTGFVDGAVPAAVALAGYRLLQGPGFDVDPMNERIEPRPSDEIGPPFLLQPMPGQADDFGYQQD